jgi:hypothetical protein
MKGETRYEAWLQLFGLMALPAFMNVNEQGTTALHTAQMAEQIHT